MQQARRPGGGASRRGGERPRGRNGTARMAPCCRRKRASVRDREWTPPGETTEGNTGCASRREVFGPMRHRRTHSQARAEKPRLATRWQRATSKTSKVSRSPWRVVTTKTSSRGRHGRAEILQGHPSDGTRPHRVDSEGQRAVAARPNINAPVSTGSDDDVLEGTANTTDGVPSGTRRSRFAEWQLRARPR